MKNKTNEILSIISHFLSFISLISILVICVLMTLDIITFKTAIIGFASCFIGALVFKEIANYFYEKSW